MSSLLYSILIQITALTYANRFICFAPSLAIKNKQTNKQRNKNNSPRLQQSPIHSQQLESPSSAITFTGSENELKLQGAGRYVDVFFSELI